MTHPMSEKFGGQTTVLERTNSNKRIISKLSILKARLLVIK